MNQSLPKVIRTVTYCCIYKVELSLDKQQADLIVHAKGLGLTIVSNYSDNVPVYELDKRLQLNELIKAAIRKEIDCVLIYKFAAFAASVPHLLHVLKQLIKLDIRVISIYDGIDTQGEVGRDTITALQTLIELKEAFLSERTKEGLQKARLKGKKLGRPTHPMPPKVLELIEELAATTDLSIKKIREETGNILSYSITRDIINRIRKQV